MSINLLEGAYWTISASIQSNLFFLTLMSVKGGRQKRVLSPVNFSSGECNLRAWRGISEVYLELQIPAEHQSLHWPGFLAVLVILNLQCSMYS